MIQSYKDLEVHKIPFRLFKDVYWMTYDILKEEIYSFTSQNTRSSKSISGNTNEGWPIRNYESVFKQHPVYVFGSCAVTENWFSFAHECKFLNNETFSKMGDEIEQIGKMLNKLHQNWTSYGK